MKHDDNNERPGIEELRQLVDNFDSVRDSFSNHYSVFELIQLFRMWRASEWDIAPDRWSIKQVVAALLGKPPVWKEQEGGGMLPVEDRFILPYRPDLDSEIELTVNLSGSRKALAERLREVALMVEDDQRFDTLAVHHENLIVPTDTGITTTKVVQRTPSLSRARTDTAEHLIEDLTIRYRQGLSPYKDETDAKDGLGIYELECGTVVVRGIPDGYIFNVFAKDHEHLCDYELDSKGMLTREGESL